MPWPSRRARWSSTVSWGSPAGSSMAASRFRRRFLGQGTRRATASGSHRRGFRPVPLCADLPARRPRTVADRTAGRLGCEGRTPYRAGPFRAQGRRRASACSGGPTARRRPARRPISRAATVRIRSCRETLAIGFPGGTYSEIFYVADVEASGPATDGELHVDLDEADFLLVFPLKGTGLGAPGRHRARRSRHADERELTSTTSPACDRASASSAIAR